MKTYNMHCRIKGKNRKRNCTILLEADKQSSLEELFGQLKELFCENRNQTAVFNENAIELIRIEELEPIVVTVRGGLVQDISNIPEGIRVHVHDFDAQCQDDPPCMIAEWESQ